MKHILFIIFAFLFCNVSAQTISTIAGTGTSGYTGDGGPATAAQFRATYNIVFDRIGNLYVADSLNAIRKIDTAGIVSTIAGNGSTGYSGDGGPATAAQLYLPRGMAVDFAGNLYFSDANNYRIRKIDASGNITTIAGTGTLGFSGDGGPATAAKITKANQLSFDGSGNLFFVDVNSRRIRKIATTGIISTVAGAAGTGYSGDGGPASAAKLNNPGAMVADFAGNLYISDNYNYRIRMINTSDTITTIVGTGTSGFSGDGGHATAAQINQPSYISVDGCGNIYVSDAYNYRIRKINAAGIITTIAGIGTAGYSGDGGPATAARTRWPGSHAFDNYGNFYFGDPQNECIRMISHINNFPSFIGGAARYLTVCENSTASLDTFLRVHDVDSLQTEMWSSLSAPAFGVATISYGATTTASGMLTPSGLAYTPLTGFSGADTFSVLVTDCDGLKDTIMVYVTVSPLPVTGAITGPPVVCIASSITLADTPSGGSWIATNATATVSGAGLVTGILPGIDTIMYIVTNSCGADTATHSVSVNSLSVTVTPSGPTTFCTGNNVTLSADTGTGYTYQWYNGTTAISGATNSSYLAASAGSYKVTLTIATGCAFTSATTTVTINPLPNASITAAGTTTFCAGSSVALNATTASGYLYQWYNAGAAISGATTVSYSATANGSYKVYVTNTTTGCSDSTATPIMVTVNPLPSNAVSASGALTFCTGGNVTLTADTGSGYTYQWYTGSTAISGETNISYFSTASGNYKVAVTTASGCSNTSSVTSVTVNPLPATTISATGVTTFCTGGSVVLNATSVAGYNYQWSNSGTNISGATTSAYTAATNGSYTVRITNTATGCMDSTASPVVVTVNPLPSNTVTASGALTFCPGANVTFNAATGSGYTWQWYNGASTISGATHNTFTATTAGNYKARITNSFGCSDTSAVYTVSLYSAPTATITPAVSTGICYGDTATLTATSGTGYTYQWYIGSTPISGATNASYRTTTLANYTVRVTNSTGCTANSAVTAVVYAGPAAAITTAGSTYFCSGGLALHATTGTGYTWQWYNGSTIIAWATSSIYTATATGTYKVKVTDGTGCASMSAPVTATDLSLPIIVAAGPTTFCQGNSVSLSINTAGGTGSTPVIYQWKRNYVNISGATTGSYTATLGGSYTCYENIGGTCIATTPGLAVTVTNCHVEVSLDSMKQGIRLYPNPVTKELTIEGAKGLDVVFYDVVGREVLHQVVLSDMQVTNVANLPNGIYLVQILDNITGAKVVQKLLKE